MVKPAVIVVTSHVVRGGVGGRSTVFALERMGFPVWSLPTVVLPWHPGHGKASRLHPDAGDFARAVADLGGSRWLGEAGAVLVGYLGEEAQVDAAAGLVAAVRRKNPGALFLCDPDIGDAGGLFRPEPLAAAIRDRLLRQADITTPNRHEFEWLSGERIVDNDGLAVAAARLGPREVVVTSAFAPPGETGALLIAGGEVHLATHRALAEAPHGTGDLFSGLYLGHRLDGAAPPLALERAVAAVFRLVERAAEQKSDELPLADGQDAFLAAPRGVVMRRLR